MDTHSLELLQKRTARTEYSVIGTVEAFGPEFATAGHPTPVRVATGIPLAVYGEEIELALRRAKEVLDVKDK